MFEVITKNKVKTAIIVGLIFALISVVAYYISYALGYGEYAIIIAVLVSVLLSFFSYWYSDKMVLSMSGAKKAEGEEGRIIRNVLEGLCVSSGLPMPEIYIINDPSPNAFATGRNPKHSAVAVTTGLLSMMDYYQLEGVLAHEMSHIKNYDILLQTIASVMIGAVIIVSDIWRRTLFFGGRRRRSDRDNGAGAIIMIIGLLFVILAPIAGQLLKMALSRNREYLADATAIEFTRNPEGLATALEKLGAASTPVARANNATAGLYITNPLKAARGEGLTNLFSTHPPIEKRVEAIRSIH
ncbi:MAG: M48 family metalloprotease [Bacillota bacterium]|nr:M48 family metalloprotease [Bacillota bacterium]